VAYEFGSNAWHVHSLSKCSEQNQIKCPVILATSQIASLLFLRTSFFTQSTSASVVLVNEHPKCSAASTEVTTLKTIVFFPLSATQRPFSTFQKFHHVFPSSKENPSSK